MNCRDDRRRTAAGSTVQHVAYVAPATGVAAGLLLDGTPRRGPHRVAGGHCRETHAGRPPRRGP